MRIVIDILICLSILFAFAGVVGMIRMPDSFMRMHSSTNITTFGVLGVLIGGIQEPQGSSDFRLRSQGPCRLGTGESGLVLG